MSDSNEPDYDPEAAAMSYGTVWTNSLFDPGTPALKFARHGVVNIFIPWAAIIWGGLFAIIFGAIGGLFFLGLFNMGGLGIPIVAFIAGLGGLIGAKIGLWSPMQKSTGEDLITYFMIAIRSRIGRGGGKVSTTKLNSKMYGGAEGRVIECTQWLGTQPLRNAPPMSLYEEDEDFATEYHIKPGGEFDVMRSSDYRDGLGDRS